jgi:hypothetical protein
LSRFSGASTVTAREVLADADGVANGLVRMVLAVRV